MASYLALVLLHIYLIAKDDEREVLWIVWAGLDEELVPPAVKRLEGLGTVHIVYENAAIGTTIERNPERLKALLTSCIPELRGARRL